MAGPSGGTPREQDVRFWPTAKALRALGYQLPASIDDSQAVAVAAVETER